MVSVLVWGHACGYHKPGMQDKPVRRQKPKEAPCESAGKLQESSFSTCCNAPSNAL